ncbi:hypothetical protein CEW92_05395 [Bacillaceae bacterium SAS-127]|nr:hypothetical protein CEW92_05395 [Bacillaceae bacterium SAS-127]
MGRTINMVIIALLIIECLLLYFFQKKYADIMGTIHVTTFYVMAVLANIIFIFSERKTARFTINVLSVLLLLVIPSYFFITKPQYEVNEALEILEKDYQTTMGFHHNQKHLEDRVYVFYSEKLDAYFYFNPHTGETSDLKQDSL